MGQPCSRRNSGFTATSALGPEAENDLCSLDAKAIQKLKEAVLREIEFEDGKIAWSMGWSSTDRGPSIDRRAIR